MRVLRIGVRDPAAAEPPPGDRDQDLELAIHAVDGVAGPALATIGPGRYLLRVPACWSELREKALATLRRTVTSALLQIGREARPALVYATDPDLCGLAALALSRLDGCLLALGLRSGEVESALFDERKIAVFEPVLAGARVIAVDDPASARLLASCRPLLAGRIATVSALPLESAELRSLVDRSPLVPWKRGREKPLPVSRPVAAGSELGYVEEVLRSGWWGYGPVARHLERQVAAYCGGDVEVLAVSSCTAALHLALLASGVGPGHEVIVPALTFVATAAAVVQTGATPRFVDVDPDTLCVDPRSVEGALTSATRALLPVDFAGLPADIPALERLADERDIAVVEDAAHAMGAARDGRRVGSLSPMTCFSFAPTKQVPSCSGGLLAYRAKPLERQLRELSNLGLVVDTRERSEVGDAAPANRVVRSGHRYRMDDVSAAIAVAQMEAIDTIIRRRRQLVDHYLRRIAEIPACEPLVVPPGVTPSWYILPVRVPEDRRDALRERLASRGIDSSIHYPSLLEQPAFSGLPGHAPVAAREARRLVTLPLWTGMTATDVDRVADAVAEFFG